MAGSAVAELHPQTASRLKVVDGGRLTHHDAARRASTMTAKVTRDIRPDTVFVPFHWPDEQSANRLTNAALDPTSRMPEFKVCAARVDPIAKEPATREAGLRDGTTPKDLKEAVLMTSPHRLVVIGNGMAGARLVEDVLARASGDRFRVTMFGDEPYGNYNRILLSGVLAGTQQPDDIFINPLDWYADNDVTLHAGVGAARIDRDAKVVYGSDGRAEPYDTLVIATGSVPFVPPIENLGPTDDLHGPGPYKDGVYVFRTLEDCERDARPRRRREVGRGHRRRPARASKRRAACRAAASRSTSST